MNEEKKFTKEKPRKRASGRYQKKSQGEKLKSETAAKKAYGKKFRHGKKATELTAEEKKKLKKLQVQGRHKIRREVAEGALVHRQVDRANEDQNVGTQALNKGAETAENTAGTLRQSRYSKKIQKQVKKGTEEKVTTHEVQKNYMKKEFQRAAYKKSQKEAANQVGSISKKFVDKAEDLVGRFAEWLREKIMDNPLILIIAVVVLIVVLMLSGSAGLAGGMLGSFSDTTIATSYTADDSDIRAVEQDYKTKESDLQTQVNNIPSTYPGYDEYRYNLV